MDTSLATHIENLRNHISGTVVTPEDAAYDQARQTLFNKTAKPALVVQCRNTDDIAQAVLFARENNLEVSVRSGGHSGPGLSNNNGGIVIDLRPMHNVSITDEAQHIVRIEGGAVWGDVAKQLADHNLAISSGDTTSVGVGGLTLGGGMGWMVRGHGLSIDNLLKVELIDANGKQLVASKDENPDLFWALRGGGGGFGVATAFTFQATPCKAIFGGHIIYPAEKRLDILTNWAAYMRTAPEELNSTIMLFPGFGPSATPQVIVIVCYAGDDEARATQAIQPLRELGGTPLGDDVAKKPYYAMLDEAKEVPGMKIRARNGFAKTLTPELIKTITDHFGMPQTSPLQIRSLGGAFSRVSNDATAFAYRDTEAFLLAPSFSPLAAAEDDANAAADALWAPLKPYLTGAYVNFLTDIRDVSLENAYPEATRKRLAEIKTHYDPTNLFQNTMTVKPLE